MYCPVWKGFLGLQCWGGRQLHAGNQPGCGMWAGLVASTMCGTDGWMDGWHGEAVSMWAREGALWHRLWAGKAVGGHDTGYPLSPNWRILHRTVQACLDAAVWLIAGVIKSHTNCQDCSSPWLHCPTTTSTFTEICREAEMGPAFVPHQTGL